MFTPDIRATTAFYRSVLGWGSEPAESAGADTYELFHLDGRTLGGVTASTDRGSGSAWTIYFTSPDVHATARAVEHGGGTVSMAPMDVLDLGRAAEFTDPQGGRFGAWTAASFTGFEAADRPGTLCWTELWTDDVTAAKKFYAGVFGWGFQDMVMPGDEEFTYTLLTPPGAGEDRMHGGLCQAEVPGPEGSAANWHPVFAVTDCDDTTARVAAEGGQVLMGPEDAEGVGRLSVGKDLFGADFVLLTPAPE
nr:VOC family protein [Nocardiopsis mwathae]